MSEFLLYILDLVEKILAYVNEIDFTIIDQIRDFITNL